jgi:hypothetical protein
MKIVAYGQGSAGAGVAARRWKAGREVTGRGRVGDDRGSREGSPAGRWWNKPSMAQVWPGDGLRARDHGADRSRLNPVSVTAGRWLSLPRNLR